MNECVKKEKEKYWDKKITLEEYIKETEKEGYIDCNANWDYEYWYILKNLKKLNEILKNTSIEKNKIDKEGI